MNRTLLTSVTLAMVMVASSAASAQKKPLDHSVYDGWQTASAVNLTDDGNTLTYVVAPQEGDATLYLENLATGKKVSVERGGTPAISPDGKWAVFSIKAPFADTRQAKIKKKKADEMPKDTVAFADLRTLEIHKLGAGSKLKTSLETNHWLAFETGSKDSLMTVVYNLDSSKSDTLRNVDKYAFDTDGLRLAAVFKKNKKDSLSKDELAIFKLATMEKNVLSEGKKFYSLPKFNDKGDKMAFLASADSNKTGNKYCSIFLYEEALKGPATTEEIIPQGYRGKLPKGTAVNENSPLSFSRLSDRLFVGYKEMIPENDTTLVDFETAQLDIWNWDIYLTPPGQKANKATLEKRMCDGVINLTQDRNNIVPLTDDPDVSTAYIDGGEGRWALVLDNRAYELSSTWDSNDFVDVSLVDLNTGEYKTLFTKLNGRPSVSPAGKYLIWFSNDDLCFYTYEIASGRTTNISEKIKGTFYDDEDDHPCPPPQFAGAYWYNDDKSLILTEKFDIWKVNPDGSKPVCLTEGKGRAANTQYRYTTLLRDKTRAALKEVGVRQTIGDKDIIYLTTFDRGSKENGYASVKAKGGIVSSFTEKMGYSSAIKAYDADVIAFRMGDFRHSSDVYITRDNWKSSEKKSAVNPQQSGYRWGDVRLVHWNAYDGTPLDGLLYVPEDIRKDEKIPLMIYFYEKRSETLYSYISPAPSRSTVNIPFFVSRGYAVFVPDIVYTVGHPGESAYNCICSGAEAMCEQHPFIDKSRMAIQGQSWGGYQTAYLVTRTNMFAAAGAGAPVGNMTSAYGGIRWESGMVRAMQYEHGQSRIGTSLWDEGGLDLYIENSPIFHTQNVTTPVLIMHNDNDGAVPWYQGIEFFMALRRFEHPAWLLEYNNESHNLSERRNAKDLSIRLQQFFDHYLKGEPAPAWMKTGVPLSRKGQYFGFETD